MYEPVVAVLQKLITFTRIEQVTWRRTDDPETFILVRSHGTLTIGPTSGSMDPEYQFLYVRFTDDDGTVTFEFHESNSESDLDAPMHRLWEAAQEQTSEVGKTMGQWIDDLDSLGEPF